jgi:[ribosomal protein S5]-alanine N-acetyltransferase
MTPTIATPRLMLKHLTKATPRNLAWLRDPQVVRYSQQQHSHHSLSTQLRYVQSFGAGSHIWAIINLGDGEHIGNVTARRDPPNNVADVGIMIGNTDCWGKGYGKEAWKAACGWLLGKDGGAVRKLEAGCARSNEAMLRIIRDSGFKQEGELLNKFVFNRQLDSVLLFGRTM